VARNLMFAVERCHLSVEAMAAAPFAAGLCALADDEADLGAAVVDIGAGTTTAAVFSHGRLVHADAFALGGNHVTMDLDRGLTGVPGRARGADGRLEPARRPARDRRPDPRAPGAGRTAARRRRPARSRQGPGVRGRGRPLDLSAGSASRTIRNAAHATAHDGD